MDEVLANQPIVLDNGSGVVKAGIAGEDQPSVLLNNYVGYPKHKKVMAGQGMEGDHFVGQSAEQHRGILRLEHPMSHGTVKNWNAMEKVWEASFRGLKAQSADHPILLTEAPLNPRQNRERAAQILFETFGVPAIYVGVGSVLALYAAGQTTGIVLSSGDGVSYTTPVYEGFSVPRATMRSNVAGQDVTDYLQLLLRKQGVDLLSSSERQIVADIKNKHSFVSLDPLRQEKDMAIASEKSLYKLPDGQVITLGPEIFKAPELLFKPHLAGSEDLGASQLVLDACSRVDRDLRPHLYNNIVLAGGATLTKGYGNRLLQDLKLSTPKGSKLRISAPRERKYTTWIGGSILGGLSTFTKMWVSFKDWQENPDLIHQFA